MINLSVTATMADSSLSLASPFAAKQNINIRHNNNSMKSKGVGEEGLQRMMDRPARWCYDDTE